MADRSTRLPGHPDLTRRDFLARGSVRRAAALLGGGAAASPVVAAAERGTEPGDTSARDLRQMTRAELQAALNRIRARWRTRR